MLPYTTVLYHMNVVTTHVAKLGTYWFNLVKCYNFPAKKEAVTRRLKYFHLDQLIKNCESKEDNLIVKV